MRIQNIVHNGVGFAMMTADELRTAGVPEATILAAVSSEIGRAGEAEIDRLGDLLSVSSSRSARYSEKLVEAKAFIAANRPANPAAGLYPILSAEAFARSITRAALADMVIVRAGAFTQLMALAEAQRAKIGISVAAANSIDAKKQAAETEVAVFRTAVNAALAG